MCSASSQRDLRGICRSSPWERVSVWAGHTQALVPDTRADQALSWHSLSPFSAPSLEGSEEDLSKVRNWGEVLHVPPPLF